MPATQTAPRVSFQIAEDGEAIGTLQQFADRLPLSESMILSCLQRYDEVSILLRTEADNPVLIVDPDGIDALLQCAAGEEGV